VQVQQHDAKFEVRVVKSNWEITVFRSDGEGDYDRISFDGTNMYVIHDIEKAVGKSRAAGLSVADNLALADVMERAVPRDPFSVGVGQLWLAYASSGYFKKMSEGEFSEIPYHETMSVPNTIGHSEKRQTYWEPSDNLVDPPRQVDYLGTDKKSTNAIYLATAFVKLDDLRLPKNATFEVYWDFASSGLPQKVVKQCSYSIVADKIQHFSGALTFPPKVAVLTRVFDHRFNNITDKVEVVRYSTDQRILSRVEVLNLPKDAKKAYQFAGSDVQSTHTALGTHGVPGRWLAVAFVGTNVLLLSVYLVTAKKQKRTN
jgi:hypothetical protein